MIAWDNRDDLNPLHIWMINGNEIIRGIKLRKRDNLPITNKHKYLLYFDKYELKDELEKLEHLTKESMNNQVLT